MRDNATEAAFSSAAELVGNNILRIGSALHFKIDLYAEAGLCFGYLDILFWCVNDHLGYASDV